MLSEMLAIRSDQPADEFALISKSFQQGSRHGVNVSEIDQRLGEPRARRVGWKEVPAINLSLANVVANELLLDAAGLHEVSRIVDHGDGSANRLVVCQVARLGKDDHTGLNASRLVSFANFARLIRPENERAAIENVTL